mmetsp:Transcript_11144/g.30160  ORF Transcript_11144/g.30160 Transcript_11144/m.30160 type:complete len:224 (-) Transcript_11144:38-709(-)
MRVRARCSRVEMSKGAPGVLSSSDAALTLRALCSPVKALASMPPRFFLLFSRSRRAASNSMPAGPCLCSRGSVMGKTVVLSSASTCSALRDLCTMLEATQSRRRSDSNVSVATSTLRQDSPDDSFASASSCAREDPVSPWGSSEACTASGSTGMPSTRRCACGAAANEAAAAVVMTSGPDASGRSAGAGAEENAWAWSSSVSSSPSLGVGAAAGERSAPPSIL